MPTYRQLEDAGAKALRDGPGSQAMRDLRALNDRVQAAGNLDATDKLLVQQYYDAIQQTQSARTTLSGTAGLNQAILDHGMVDGDTKWRPGRRFQTQTMGGLHDLITAELRSRIPRRSSTTQSP